MLINMPPHIISTLPRLVAIPLLLLACSLFFLPRRHDHPSAFNPVHYQGKNVTEAGSTFGAAVQGFWQDLASALLAAQPQCKPLQLVKDDIGSAADWRPLEPERKHADRLAGFTDDDETALFRAHYAMRTSAQHLGSKLSFAKGTTGIVTTANAVYMPVFLVSLRMLRRTGCNLPVEVFIDDWSKYEPKICDTILPSLQARCVVLSNVYDTAEYIKQPDHYQYKVFAMLFSTFQHVLFLDSDTFPVYDPTILFSTAPYTTHGLVTWPDYWALTISAHFYHIAAIPEEPSQARFTTESGQLMINKDVHRESLLMMVYYNYYGPDYYYTLLSQGSHGAGDKETFVQAAMAVGLPYYQVRSGPRAIGRHMNGTFRGSAIAQADPGLDYEYLTPMRSHIHPSDQWQNTDLAHPVPAVEKSLNRTRKAPRRPRPVFLHQNMLKLDPAKVLVDKSQPTYELDGTPHRMWGSKEDMVEMLGYDVERRLWDVIAEEGCREDQASRTCGEIRGFVREVFGWMDSIDRPW
ncbi:glycosyltransferase family 71 protein [Cucurbitaria berberidis CBS 394.84]|uniref:Glycosyltransferase family 71 protein n=1 Tax=Cucurbitaria berberidis CBS 394.84 TaxID=1168544 RepID=A0A9P4GMJ4_9PLEO|nr:glycosyltransferase family 71 protein [Cucurbitaria berberidis CBS 394.84]KAF1848056.1 glycosyltransferase family 71 protein [Cucurbitaria berberidis CBS 394.84]